MFLLTVGFVRGRMAVGFSEWEVVGLGSPTSASAAPASVEPIDGFDQLYHSEVSAGLTIVREPRPQTFPGGGGHRYDLPHLRHVRWGWKEG